MTKLPYRALSLTASALALAAPALHAEQPAGVAGALLPTVTVLGSSAGKTSLSGAAESLPASVSVVEAEDIGTVNVGRDISNIFRRVPGVVANNLDQGDTGNGFKMRGFATQGTHGADAAVYIDGVPQNMPSSEAGAGHGPAFLEWLTPDMIERVEVIKGPVSVRHGDQNRSGAVNIVTRSGGVPSSVALAMESYGGRRASLVHAAQVGRVDSFLVVDSYRTDGYRKGSWLERDNLFWKLSAVHGDARYSVRVNHYRSSFETAGYLNYDQLAAGNVARNAPEPGVPPGFGEGRRTALVFGRAPLGEAGLELTAYAENFERLRATSAAAAVHNAGLDDRRIHGGTAAWRAVFPAASLLAGADYRRDMGDGTRQRLQNRQPTTTWLTNLELDLVTYGLFAEIQYKPADTVKLTAGLRQDWFDYAIDNHKLPAASATYDKSVFTPKLGVAWTGAGWTAFANAAEGFRSAAAQQISPAGAAGPLGAAGGQVTHAISPSKVRSYDLGFQAQPAAHWALSGTFFYVLNEDEIVQTGPTSFAAAGDTTRRGIEFATRLRAARNIDVHASFTHLMQARFNNPLPNTQRDISVARNQAKAGIELRQPQATGSLRYNVDAYLTAGIPYATGAPLTARTVPTHTRYDVRVAWDYRQAQLSAYAAFQPHAIGESFYASATGLWVSPQPRRTAGVTLRYLF